MKLKLTLCITLAFGLLSCSQPVPQKFPDAPVILISVDTLRSDFVGAYGSTRSKTPNFDAFAKDAVVFNHGYAHSPLTLPSHATILTGLLPPNHGVRENVGFKLAESQKTLPEQLKEHGYKTGAVISSMVLRKATGVLQGFDFYDDFFELGRHKNVKTYQERDGHLTYKIAESWLKKHKDEKIFFWLHLYDAHTPYDPPKSFKKQFKEPYAADVAYQDSILGEIFKSLKEMGLYDKAIIYLVSDHGEGLGDHGEMQHGLFTYREIIQVPYMIKLPKNAAAGTRVDTSAGLFDIMPTTLDLLDLPAPKTDGMALFNGKVPHRDIYSEAMTGELHYGYYSSRSIVHKNKHYIIGKEEELFDLKKDVNEKNNLFGKEAIPSTAIETLEKFSSGQEETAEISEADKEMLESLGYTGSFDFGDSAKNMSQQEFLKVYQLVLHTKNLINDDKLDEAEQLLRQSLDKYPAMLDIRIMLGAVLNQLKDYIASEALHTEGFAVAPDHPAIIQGLISAKLGLKKNDEAAKLAHKVMALAPVLVGRKIVVLFFQHEDFENTLKFAKILEEHDPKMSFLYTILGQAVHEEADIQQILNKALATQTKHLTKDQLIDALFYIGDTMGRTGKYDDSMVLFNELLKHEKNHGPTRISMAKVLASQKKTEEAIGILDTWVYEFPTKQNYLDAAQAMEDIGIAKAAEFYKKEANKYQ